MEKLSKIGLLTIIFHLMATHFVYYGDARNVNCAASDLLALLDFKNGLNDPEGRLSLWRGNNCCQWRGIGCDNTTGAVIKVDLHNPYPVNSDYVLRYGFWNLSGEISPSLLKLKSLRHLDLGFNTFDGIPIPGFLGSLKSLQYLNLSRAGFSGTIPSSLGNLSSLQYLDVSSDFSALTVNNFLWVTGLVSLKHLQMNQVDLSLIESNWLEMLNTLPYLTDLHLSSCGLSGSISALNSVNFTSLATMDLSGNQFDKFPDWLVNVSSLEDVDLSSCNLRGRIPLGLSELPNLQNLNLALNYNLSASSHVLFKGSWKKIEVLNLAANKIHGKLTAAIGNMTSLTNFNLFVNDIEGGIPGTIGRLCNLTFFDLSGNNLTGSLPESLEGTELCTSVGPLPRLMNLRLSNNQLVGKLPEWLGQVSVLEEFQLSYNRLEGPIPASLGRLEKLTSIGLAGNRLNGTLPESFGKLSKLSSLDVSSNQLTGIVSEGHFARLNNLTILQLAFNSFTLNVSSDWIPPFQVRNLGMGSCQMGPLFPAWLQSQKKLQYLDMSNASISGSMPDWFWVISSNLSLLNFSINHLEGHLPNPISIASYADIDLSSNLFEGTIPLPIVPIELLDLSNNKFHGSIPHNITDSMPDLIFLSLSGNRLEGEIPATIGEMVLLQAIDLSGNNLTGSIPSSIGNCSYLKVLDLGDNSLSGVIPSSLGQLNQLQSLHLNDNIFSNEIPSSFQNLSSLETLDLGNNRLSGTVPAWFSERNFTNLRILILRSNEFSGELPTWISKLSSLQVLDLAENNLTGRIPANIGDLKAMWEKQIRNQYLFYGRYQGVYFEERLLVNIQNRFQKYTKTLSLLTAVDLSGNNLSGEFPVELTKLFGLVSLNLARNKISGQIPENISSLDQLTSLDLSNNNLSGAIPPSMASMPFLSYLNLSNNDFSGMIPYTGQMSTFENSSFQGNPKLCGGPLTVSCQKKDTDNINNNGDDKDDTIVNNRWFYLSLGLGFAAGILVPYLVMAIKRSWSDVYFDFVDRLAYWLLSLLLSNRRTGNKNRPSRL